MHIPDGFLDAKTLAVTTGLAAVGVTAAVRQARTQLPPRKVPLLGVTAAFVFAAALGFLGRAVKTPLVPTLIPDYALPGIASPAWATAIAGGIGTTVVFLVVLAIARVIVPRPRGDAGPASTSG